MTMAYNLDVPRGTQRLYFFETINMFVFKLFLNVS